MTTTTCPGCHGAGTEMSGTTHAGLAEHLACDECGPECPDDCGCRASDATERPESIAPRHPGATQSPSGYPSDPPPLKGPQNRVERDRYGLILTEPERALLDGISGTFPETALVGIVDRLVGEVERLGGSRLVDAIAAQARAEEVDRLTAERDRARGTAATLEAENARLTEALYLTRITLEATFRVLQEASGLPDDIDDPDCRDEMVLALRPRAEKAEAEVARLRAGIEALAAEMQSDTCPACHAFYAACCIPSVLRALLAEGGDRG